MTKIVDVFNDLNRRFSRNVVFTSKINRWSPLFILESGVWKFGIPEIIFNFWSLVNEVCSLRVQYVVVTWEPKWNFGGHVLFHYVLKSIVLVLPTKVLINILWVSPMVIYRKIASSNTSRLEAHVGFFRLLMKGIFGPYVLWPFDKKLIF